jgi:isopenicillin N synthase-like dioxygenase
MSIPIIDFDQPHDQLVTSVDRALQNFGFMMITNLGVSTAQLHQVYEASKNFFTGSTAVKASCAYLSAAENFGYQGLSEENLDPSAPADLKETFTMRNILNRPLADGRWPSRDFQTLITQFYADALQAGYRLQRVLAQALDQPDDFFVQFHSGENVTLRLLYYPHSSAEQIQDRQMGAGAHTDYGLTTLLFQDQVGGLQVRDKQGTWLDVPPLQDAIVINSGDLLEIWTNGRYTSTEHRVLPQIGGQQRLSIAMFIDPDSQTQVAPLSGCITDQAPARYTPISAGAHLQQKIEASHKNRFKAS